MSIQARIGQFIQAPRFANDEESRSARLLNQVLMVSLTLIAFSYLTLIPSTSKGWGALIITGLLGMTLAAKFMLNRGRLHQAGGIFAFSLWTILVLSAYFSGGIKDPTYFALSAVIIMAGLVLSGRSGLIIAFMSAAAGLILLMLELNNGLPAPLIQVTPTGTWIAYIVLFFVIATLVYVTTQSLREALARARDNEQAQRRAYQELEGIRAGLEAQVEERTADLEQRARYLAASAEVSRFTSSILDPNILIQEAAEFIRAQFDLYYVGVFLTDRMGKWAELAAGTGPAGQAMLSRAHRIEVGTGMIGWSIANHRARVALEAGQDALRLATPELPETRSEAAIPLRSRGETLGAISVQSTQPQAFSEPQIDTLQVMADQVAVALDNARLLAQTQQALETSRRAYGEISRQAWEALLRGDVQPAFRYESGSLQSGGRLEPIQSAWSATMQAAAAQGHPLQSANGQHTLHVPIRVRDQVIGVLNFHKGAARSDDAPATDRAAWSETEINLLASLSDQLGAALESARLYQETQRQALRARLTGDVTAQIRATLDIETVLQTAAREVRQALDLPEVTIHLVGPDDVPGSTPLPEAGGRGPADLG